jgi:phosphoglycolate phosphatase
MAASWVIFDLDGTLVDSAADLHRAVNLMLREFGCAPLSLAQVRGMIGDGVSKLVARALAARQCASPDDARAQRLFMDHYAADPTTLTRPYPGVPETLDLLRGRGSTLAVCTNKPVHLAQVILERLGIGRHFARVMGGDSLPFRKPDPRVLTEMMTALEASPASSWMVGDSEVDSETAYAAGVPFVLMTYGYHRRPTSEIPCLAALDHFPELAAFLDA